jgi:hypothetical protein
MATNNAINLKNSGLAKYDGAGTFSAVTVSQNAALIGGSSNGITSLALTNGQLAIGNTGNDPSAATLSAGSGVSITNGAGSITINAVGSGLTWTVETISGTLAVNHGYGVNGAAVSLALPAAAAVGDMIEVTGMTGNWIITQGVGQTIHFGASTTTTGGGGSLASSNAGDSVKLVCLIANTDFYVVSSIGNITIV